MDGARKILKTPEIEPELINLYIKNSKEYMLKSRK
jgi:hypothetical protein